MPCEDVFQSFSEEEIDRGAEGAEHVGWWGIGKKTILVGFDHVVKIEIAAMQASGFAGGKRLLRHTNNGKAYGQHEAFLRARDANIDAPFIHAKINGGKR